MKTQANVQAKTRTHAADHAGVNGEASRGAIVLMSAVPSLIGLWGVACFVGAMAANGGPIGMAANWFRAVGGM